jgi:hypothetical protein
MFSDFIFPIAKNQKLKNLKKKHKTKFFVFQRTLKQNHTIFMLCEGSIFLKKIQKTSKWFSYFAKIGFFERTLQKM